MKIIQLTYNELVKQFKKTGTKVLFVLVMLLAILLPIGTSLINSSLLQSGHEESDKYMLEQAEENVNEFINDQTNEGKINLATSNAEYETYKLSLDAKIGYDDSLGLADWRASVLQDFRYLNYEIEAIKLVLAGFPQDILLQKMYNINPTEINEIYSMSKENQQKKIDEKNVTKNELYSMIINKDYMAYLNKDISEIRQTIENFQKNQGELEKELAKDESKTELKNQIEEIKSKIAYDEKKLELQQYRYDNKINFEVTNWKSNALSDIAEALEKDQNQLMSEEKFYREASLNRNNSSYDQYKKTFELQKIKLAETIAENWYSLKNNIPQLDDITDARTAMDQIYEVFSMAAVILVIVIGGGIVSTEFSKGTIRLLLTRPVSRWKVLASKLIALLVIGYGVMLVTTVIGFITSGFVYGFETLQIPILATVNQAIVEQSFISVLVGNLMISSLSLIFITSLMFMISTVAKNTAMAVAISLVLYLCAMPLTNILTTQGMTFIGSTFVPFINQPLLNLTMNGITDAVQQSQLVLNPQAGLMQLMILSIIFIGISFITFTKKDVQN